MPIKPEQPNRLGGMSISTLSVGIALMLASVALFGQVPTNQVAGPLTNNALAKCNSKDVASAFNPQPNYERLENLLVICREEGNKLHSAWILREIGNIHIRERDANKAINVWKEALRINEELGNVTGSITVILNLGSAYRYQKNDQKQAGEYLRKLLKLSDNPGPTYRSLIAGALGTLAHFEATEGDPEQALIVSDRILTLRQEIGDPRGIAGALSLKGEVYGLLGDNPKALDLYRQALSKIEEIGDKGLSASILYKIGYLYRQLGYPTYALEFLERSLKINEELGVSNQLLLDLTGVAYTHYQLRDLHKALEVFHRLLKLLDDLQNDPSSEAATSLRRRHGSIGEAFTASTLQPIGRIYIELGMFDSAVEYLQRAVANAEKDGGSSMGISAAQSLGEARIAQGRYGEAIESFLKSLTFCNSGDGRNRNFGMFPLTRIAETYAKQGKFVEGREFAEKAELLSKQLTQKDGHYPFVLLGAAFIALGDFEKARVSLERAIIIAEGKTRQITDAEERLKFFEEIHDPYKLYIHSLMQLHWRSPSVGFDSNALEVNERARIRSLLETLEKPGKNSSAGVDPALRSKELELQRKLSAAAELQVRPQESVSMLKTTEIEALKAELRLTMAEISSRESRYSELTRPETLSWPQISRELLDEDTALIEYSLGDHGSYAWLVTNSFLFAYELPNRVEIEHSARQVYKLLSETERPTRNGGTDVEYTQSATKLSDMLLGPVAAKIKGKRLVIVADGALQYIPFSALPRPGANSSSQPLAMTNEIVSLSSASVLSVLRKEAASRKPAEKGAAIVADPVFSETDERVTEKRHKPAATQTKAGEVKKLDLSRMALERAFSFSRESGKPISIPRLPFTRREAESIFASAPKPISFKVLDFEASKDAVLGRDLSQYKIVHLATHGILHSEHPELSGIVLSLVNEKGQPVNGFLRLNEIYNMKLNADLVVLSACQTALGKEVRGEGLIGLTRGFMYAGTSRVVASLWKVDDVATAEFMKIFYQKMLKEKLRPAAALREAKIEMMKQKRWRSPYYWAAFELQGDWR